MSKEHHIASPYNTDAFSTLLINTPAMNYDLFDRQEGSRELTPYGLGAVATMETVLTHETVGLLDAEFNGLGHETIISEVVTAVPNKGVVGINVITPLYFDSIHIAKRIAETRPDIKIVFGGPHATLDPHSLLQHVPNAIVIQGDGEGAIAEIQAGKNFADIAGAYFMANGSVKKGQFGLPRATEVHNSPKIERAFFANEPYSKNGKQTMTMLSSRGCRGGCAFCITPAQYEIMKSVAKKVRFRKMADVVAEAVELHTHFGADQIQFIDDDIFANVSRVKEFVEQWEQAGLSGNMDFLALLRPDLIPKFEEEGLIKALAASGLRKLSLGIETGHDSGRLLVSGGKKIDNKYNPHNVVTTLRILSQYDIEVKGFFMVGMPGETRDQIEETIAFMHSLKSEGLSRVAMFPVKVYPGTGLWQAALELGFTPEELGAYYAPSIADRALNPQKVKDQTRDIYAPTTQLSEVPTEELQQICQENMSLFNGS